MDEKLLYLQVEKHKADMLRSDIKYWNKRCKLLQQEKEELIKWLEDRIKSSEQSLTQPFIENITKKKHYTKIKTYKEILNKIIGVDTDE